jgi:hypothetical protein
MNAPVDPTIPARAGQYLAEKLGLPAGSVTVGIGAGMGQYPAGTTMDDLGAHSFAITITDPQVAANFAAMEKSALEGLSKIELFKSMVQFESDAANVVHRRDQLEKFRLGGAQIPENFKDWKGFNPDLAEAWGSISDHAVQNVHRNPTDGVKWNINIPASTDAVKIGAEIKADIEARKGEIMRRYKLGAIKYLTRGMDDTQKEAKKADIEKQFEDVTMEVNYTEPSAGGNYSSPGHIHVSIASKKQRDCLIAFKEKTMTPEDRETLQNTNPLTAAPADKTKGEYAISSDDIAKATGRALLFEGDNVDGDKAQKPVALFPKLAGKEDMKRAITDALIDFKQANSAMAKEVDEFLGDEAFKGQDWQKPKRLQQEHKVTPMVVKDAKDPAKANIMSIEFSFKADKAQKLLEDMAAAAAAPEQATANAKPTQEGWLAMVEAQKAAKQATVSAGKGAA